MENKNCIDILEPLDTKHRIKAVVGTIPVVLLMGLEMLASGVVLAIRGANNYVGKLIEK